MPTTAKAIIDAAYARSTFNEPDKLATNSELIGVIDRRLKQLYSLAARNNPLYFGKRLPVTYDAGVQGWPRPNDAEMVVSLYYSATGDEVHIVPFDDRIAEMPPRVYEFGKVYFSVGTPSDPTAESIDFFYSKRHPDLDASQPATAAVNTVDSSWPEQFNDLMVLHVARYLSIKDQREGEVQILAAEEAALLEVFFRHLAHENYGMKARWGQRARLVSLRPEGFREE